MGVNLLEFNIEEEQKKWKLTEDEFLDNLEDIFNQLALTSKSVELPTFVMVGGQAGSGKTQLVGKTSSNLEGNAIIIDQDELRTKFPEEKYQQIHDNYTEREEFLILKPYISKLVKAIIQKAKEGNYNIVLESALRSIKTFKDYPAQLRVAGYRTELSVLAVPELEANISMLVRYCEFLQRDGECRRNTRLDHEAVLKIKENIQKLDELDVFDDIKISIRSKEKNKLPVLIYSKSENTNETPVEAFQRGEQITLETTKKTFPKKYKEIKKFLNENEKDSLQLEKLEILRKQYEQEFNIDIDSYGFDSSTNDNRY